MPLASEYLKNNKQKKKIKVGIIKFCKFEIVTETVLYIKVI